MKIQTTTGITICIAIITSIALPFKTPTRNEGDIDMSINIRDDST